MGNNGLIEPKPGFSPACCLSGPVQCPATALVAYKIKNLKIGFIETPPPRSLSESKRCEAGSVRQPAGGWTAGGRCNRHAGRLLIRIRVCAGRLLRRAPFPPANPSAACEAAVPQEAIQASGRGAGGAAPFPPANPSAAYDAADRSALVPKLRAGEEYNHKCWVAGPKINRPPARDPTFAQARGHREPSQ